MRIANLRNMLAACVFLSVIVCPAVGKIIYVNDDATGANNGTSWTDAYTDLQSAVATSISSDQIWVAAGTYKPGSSRYDSFQMKNGVGIYGGFAGNEDPNLFDPADRDFTTSETILSGDIGAVGNNTDNCYHVIYNQQGTTLDSSAVLDGFTITAGNANSSTYPDDRGGGMLNYDCNTSIATCTFSANSSLNYGGGMYNRDSSPKVSDCNFSDNDASYGGALFNWSSGPNVVSCSFKTNTARGGAVYNYDHSYPSFSYCIFNNNSGDYAGAVFSQDSNSAFFYCDFTNNSASESAGAIYNARSSPFLKNCLFANNTATNSAGAIYNWDNSSPNLTDCNFFQNRSDKLGVSDAGAIKNSQNSDPAITYCNFSWNSCDRWGGAIFNYDNSNPILQNCTFADNYASSGGGIYNWDSNPTISNCKFIHNETSSMGGGLFNTEYSSPVVKNCIFERNYAEINGGGLENWYDCSPTVTNCIFYGNFAQSGGGMFNLRSNAIVTNCLFIRNSGGWGGGMRNDTSSNTTVINCTFFANLAEYNVGGIENEGGCTLELTNCILWANTDQGGSDQSAQLSGGIVEVNYSCVQGWDGTLGGNGNIDADPCFVDANGLDDIIGMEDDNLRLMPDSPCIDAGDNNSVPEDANDLDGDGNTVEPIPWDLDGHPRILDGDCHDVDVVDMGAYEFNYAYMGDLDYNCSVDFFDLSIFGRAWETKAGDPGWDWACDMSYPPDDYIDWRDVAILCDNWLAQIP